MGEPLSMADVATMCDDVDADVDGADFDPAKYHIEECMVAAVMKGLEEEIGQPAGGGGGGFEQHQVAPASSASPFGTVNGTEESCGPSFSDSASTVMASIDTRSVAGLPQLAPAGEGEGEGGSGNDGDVWPWPLEEGDGAFDAAAAAEFGTEGAGVAGDGGWLAGGLAGTGPEGEGEHRLGG